MEKFDYTLELTRHEYCDILTGLKLRLKEVEKTNNKNHGIYDEQVQEMEELVSKILNWKDNDTKALDESL